MVTSPPELSTAKPLAAARSEAAEAVMAESARKNVKVRMKGITVLNVVNWRGDR